MHLFALLAAADGFNEDRMRLLVGIFSCEFIECCHAFLNAHHRPRLQADRECNEGQANVERKAEIFGFTEKDHCENDGINGFQVIGEVDGEGGDFFERLNLQDVHPNRAETRENEQVKEVDWGWQERLRRSDGKVPRHEHERTGQSAEKLPAHNRRCTILCFVHAEKDGKRGGCSRTRQTQHNAGSVLCIEVKDERNAEDRED